MDVLFWYDPITSDEQYILITMAMNGISFIDNAKDIYHCHYSCFRPKNKLYISVPMLEWYISVLKEYILVPMLERYILVPMLEWYISVPMVEWYISVLVLEWCILVPELEGYISVLEGHLLMTVLSGWKGNGSAWSRNIFRMTMKVVNIRMGMAGRYITIILLERF